MPSTRRATVLARKLYRDSAEVRLKNIARANAYHEANRSDATWLRLVSVRKAICRKRDLIDKHSRAQDKFEQELLELIQERSLLQALRASPRRRAQ